jgi:hypothetical protein
MGIVKYFVGLNRKYSKLLEKKYPRYFDSLPYKGELLRRISLSIEKGCVNKVLEVGGVDRPLLRKGQGYEYNGLDIESRDKCYEVYDNFIVQSIEEPVNEKYDLIISITLMEHVPNNESSIDSVYHSLHPGGETHHYIPSKWHPYAVALRIVGPAIQKRLIPILRPGTEDVTGYPAYFDKCSIPSMRKLLIKRGFTDVDIQAYYRANDYFAFFTPLFLVVTTFENFCRKLGLDIFASGFVISAKKRV